MQELCEELRQGQLPGLEALHRVAEHSEMQSLTWSEVVGRPQAQQDRQHHREYEKPERRNPYPVHLAMRAQTGNTDRNGGEHQRDQYHFQKIDEQRADKPRAIKRVLRHGGILADHREP